MARVYELPTQYRMLPVAGAMSAVLTLAPVFAWVWVWRSGARPHERRVGHVVATIAAIAFLPWLAYWQLIGPSF